MSDKTFHKEELEVRGIYPTVGDFFGYPIYPTTILNSPVTPKENFISFLKNEPVWWIPDCVADYNEIYPHVVPDNKALTAEGGIDAFGVTWSPEEGEAGLPAMVIPGNPFLKNIENWHEITISDPDCWDWESAAAEYRGKLDPTRLSRVQIVTGLYERLISLMDFAEAATALFDEPEEVAAFFEKITDFNISVLRNYHKHFDVDAVVFMDDWGHQNGPMFSRSIYRELFMPSVKRIIDCAHDLGLFFIMHSDGQADVFLPEMIEMGVDMWQLDFGATKEYLPETIEKYKGQIHFEITWEITLGLTEKEAKNEIKGFVETYLKSGSACATIYNLYAYENIDLRGYYYELCRNIANELTIS